jgi:hypothetical protein
MAEGSPVMNQSNRRCSANRVAEGFTHPTPTQPSIRVRTGITSLKSVISRSQGKLLLSDGNDHLYDDPEYSWDAYIHA